MRGRDFRTIAQILVGINDPWARNQAINGACFHLGQRYSYFSSIEFRQYILSIERDDRNQHAE